MIQEKIQPTSNPVKGSREPELLGQTVVVIGGSGGIGLETARRARVEGAKVILTGRDPERLERAASEFEALSTTAFDATDPASLELFFSWPASDRPRDGDGRRTALWTPPGHGHRATASMSIRS